MSDVDARQIERMRTVFDRQRAGFDSVPERTVAQRRADLKALEDAVLARKDQIAEAVSDDFGVRSKSETLAAEVAYVAREARHARAKLRRWARPRGVGVDIVMLPGRAYVRPQPKGVVGIISPWNYPVQLALAPLTAALAAGCRALIKPSELTPRTSALIAEMIEALYDVTHVSVVTGGTAVGEAFARLPFDHLFFTGSTRVGRMVAQAAAENLTPVTLELGGKSPALIAPGYPLEPAAHAIAWGKFLNAGQTCIAPDYVLAPRAEAESIARAVVEHAETFYPDPASDEDYTSIVSDRHYERLAAMIEEAREAGATILTASHDAEAARAARKIPPSVVLDPPADCALMREEVFGPVLTVIPYDRRLDAIAHVKAGEKPLALYVFDKDRSAARDAVGRMLSGGATINGALLHISISALPFGGIGASGIGHYHGRWGFDAFSHLRGVFEAPTRHPSRMLAPPYGRAFERLLNILLRH